MHPIALIKQHKALAAVAVGALLMWALWPRKKGRTMFNLPPVIITAGGGDTK